MGSHLGGFFQLVLEASWQSSLIIVLILLVRPLMGARIPARWRYLLWALVLIRLLVPVSLFPPSPVSMQNMAVVDRPLEQAGFVAPVEPEPFRGPIRMGSESGEMLFSPAPAKSPTISWWSVASAIWLAGTAVALGVIFCAQVLMWRRVGKTREPVDPLILETWDNCCARLRVTRRPALRVSPDVASPALVGLIHPVLLLPEKNTAAFLREDWENVFVHELAHYRRADHWTHALQLVALAVHWFNPLVWLGFRQLRADRELAADEWALQHLGAESSAAYGGTLLKVLEQSSGPGLSVAAVGILEDRVQLKQRLQRIVAFGPRTLIGSLLGFAIVVSVALLVLGRPTEKADLANYPGMTPEQILITAAIDGDLPTVRQLINEGMSPETQLKEGSNTAITFAAYYGHLDIVCFLVSKGAEINPVTSSNPVLAALKMGYQDCAEYVLQHGAKCDPAILAAAKGDRALLEKALEQSPANAGKLQLMCTIAAVNGQASVYSFLLGKIHTLPGQSGWTLGEVVRQVVALERREVVQMLIDQGETFNKGNVMRLCGPLDGHPEMRAWMAARGFTAPDYLDGEKLIDAAGDDNVPRMMRLIKAGADVNYHGESSWTPALYAACRSKQSAVKFLLAHGADPNAVHIPGSNYTGLNLSDKPEIAAMFIAAGAHFDPKLHPEQMHLIDYPLAMGSTKLVEWYLNHGINPAAYHSEDGRTLLFNAPNPEIAEMLIQHGVDVKAKARDGMTALHWICIAVKNSSETARVLLKHGADPNARDDRGSTPLMYAKDGATVDVLVEFGADVKVKTKEGETVIESSGNMADASRLEALIRHGIPFDPKTQGPTMMMHAAWSNEIDIISALLKQGVDPNAKGLWNKQYNDYMTPLTAAVTDGQYEAAKILVEHGAMIQAPDENGKPGINEMNNALQNRRTQMVKLFWERGDRSVSELTYAISQGRPIGEIQKLLDGGMPVDPPQDKALRPLTLAAELGQMDVVTLLVQRGAKVDDKSHAPLAQAAWEGQDEIVAYLLQHGAKADYQVLWNAVWNCNPYPDQRTKDHFEKTIRLLLDSGATKGFSEHQSADMLIASIFTRYPAGNAVVVKMLLDSGLSLSARTDKGKSVLDLVHDACKDQTCSTPTKEMLAFLAPYGTAKPAK